MREAIVSIIIRFILLFLCKIDAHEIKRIPKTGPLILFGNHINFLDAPVIFTALWPRKVVSLVKKETFDNPLLKFLFDSWHSIPVNRGTADFTAFNAVMKALSEGKILGLSPEGTRTNDGKLIQGNPGIIAIAQKSGASVIPVACFGAEEFRKNLKLLKRTRIIIKVGEPFKLKSDQTFPDREMRRAMTDEMMYRLALLLPEKYRGYYSDLDKATCNYLVKSDIQLVNKV